MKVCDIVRQYCINCLPCEAIRKGIGGLYVLQFQNSEAAPIISSNYLKRWYNIMKKFYEKPTTDVEEFKTVDFVATSVPTDDNDVSLSAE